MWKSIKRALGGGGDEPAALETGPLGLVLGGSWSADLFAARAYADALRFRFTDGSQVVVAAGKADLGDGVTLYRYYDDDDQMLQILASSHDVDDVREVTLFQSFDSILPGSPAAWAQWTGESGWMRAPTYELDDGTVYQRAWFADTPGPAELVEFVEFVKRKREDTSGQRIAQASMLYTRQVPDSELAEHLLVIREDSGEGPSIELMVGVDLSPAQLRVF